MAFDQAASDALVKALVTVALKTGTFRRVNTHEPKSAPGSALSLAIWADSIEAQGRASGLNATSGVITLLARAYGNMLTKPEDDLDPRLMAAASVLIGALSADFTLGGLCRNIDLLGAYGQKLGARAGYLPIAGSTYRIMTITIPCVINDLWMQEP